MTSLLDPKRLYDHESHRETLFRGEPTMQLRFKKSRLAQLSRRGLLQTETKIRR